MSISKPALDARSAQHDVQWAGPGFMTRVQSSGKSLIKRLNEWSIANVAMPGMLEMNTEQQEYWAMSEEKSRLVVFGAIHRALENVTGLNSEKWGKAHSLWKHVQL